MLASILKLENLDWPVQDVSTMSRREGRPRTPRLRPLNLLVDSGGISCPVGGA